jgi:hypothetical protein
MITTNKKREVVSAYRLTEQKICSDYPELIPLVMQKGNAMNAQHNADGVDSFLRAHKIARATSERLELEIKNRYVVVV